MLQCSWTLFIKLENPVGNSAQPRRPESRYEPNCTLRCSHLRTDLVIRLISQKMCRTSLRINSGVERLSSCRVRIRVSVKMSYLCIQKYRNAELHCFEFAMEFDPMLFKTLYRQHCPSSLDSSVTCLCACHLSRRT